MTNWGPHGLFNSPATFLSPSSIRKQPYQNRLLLPPRPPTPPPTIPRYPGSRKMNGARNSFPQQLRTPAWLGIVAPVRGEPVAAARNCPRAPPPPRPPARRRRSGPPVLHHSLNHILECNPPCVGFEDEEDTMNSGGSATLLEIGTADQGESRERRLEEAWNVGRSFCLLAIVAYWPAWAGLIWMTRS